MKLQFDIIKINISTILSEMICSKEKKEEKSEKKALYAMLEMLNDTVDDQEKIELIQIILSWINEKRLLNTALQEYVAMYKQIEGSKKKKLLVEMLEKLELEIGDVSLEFAE